MKRKPSKRKPIVKTLTFEWSAAQKVPTRRMILRLINDAFRQRLIMFTSRKYTEDKRYLKAEMRLRRIMGRLDRWFGKRKGGK